MGQTLLELEALSLDREIIMKINFIGGGNMAQAIINGLLDNNYSKDDLHVMEIDPKQQLKIKSTLSISTSNIIEPGENSIIILAIKPDQIESVCKNISPKIKNHLVISIAAGVKSKKISDWLGGYKNVIRVMPNLAAKIQQGITAIYADKSISEDSRKEANKIFSAIGDILWLDNEEKMDSVTALSGSGPAYIFMFISALIDAGQKIGLSLEEAQSLSYSTVYGSTLLAKDHLNDLESLIENVTSKGGTTEQGIKILKECNLKNIIYLAAEAAYIRAKEIGNH